MGYIEIAFLLFFYLMLLVFCKLASKKIILTPEFVFIGCFIPQFVLALFYVEKWDLILCTDTFFVYILGGLLFVTYSVIVRSVGKSNYKNIYDKKVIPIPVIKKWKLIFTACFQVTAIYYMINSIKSITGQSSVTEAIAFYNIASKEAGMTISGLAAKMNLFSYMSGFIWMYYIVCGIVQKNKNNMILLITNLGLSFVNNMLTGSRGGVLQNVLFGIFLYYFMWSKTQGWKDISPRTMLKFIAIGIGIILVFQTSLQWVGRTTVVKNMSDYLAMYFSAEMKNLDIEIRHGLMSFREIPHLVTLRNLINFIEKIIRVNISDGYREINTYHYINGYVLGNVSTVYSSFIADMHYWGLFIYEGVIAVVSQFMFIKALKSDNTCFTVDLEMMIYIYILCKLAFSFFSGWFFDNIFSGGFLWTIIIWCILRIFIENNNIKKIKVLNKVIVHI